MKYKVYVEKRMYATGEVVVDCDNPDQAISIINSQIENGVLKENNIKWDNPRYEEMSFCTTEDFDVC